MAGLFPSVLFIVKQGKVEYLDQPQDPGNVRSSGLLTSAQLVVQMLRLQGIDANLELAIDNNDIDRLVTKHHPDIVFIEALWVVPSKFGVLKKLHPKVKWVIRLHSNLPFIAMEGIAIEWLFDYLDYDLYISANSLEMVQSLQQLLNRRKASELLFYSPNYYPVDFSNKKSQPFEKQSVDIGCFGAIRPLKNQLIQAVAALEFAESHALFLNFHMNTTRIEQNASSVLKNIQNLFKNSMPHILVSHPWMPRHQFLETVSAMDYALQVSFSETFNIVSADCVNQNVPVVVSDEVSWVGNFSKVSAASSVEAIVRALDLARIGKRFNLQHLNKVALDNFSTQSIKTWKMVLRNLGR